MRAKNKTFQRSVVFNIDVYNKVVELAEDNNRSFSRQINTMLEELLESYNLMDFDEFKEV